MRDKIRIFIAVVVIAAIAAIGIMLVFQPYRIGSGSYNAASNTYASGTSHAAGISGNATSPFQNSTQTYSKNLTDNDSN